MATRHRPSNSVSSTNSLMQEVSGGIATPRPSNVEEERPPFQSLSHSIYARRAEYIRTKQIRIKVGTWNVAGSKSTENDIGGWFVGGKGVVEGLSGLSIDEGEERESVPEQEHRYRSRRETIPKGDTGTVPGDDNVGIYALCLQEVVDINSATEALRPYNDPGVANKWKEAVNSVLPPGYKMVAEQQLVGLLLLVYASADVAKEVKSVSTTSVGTGLMGYMGNKGAVTARIVLGETTRIAFVNSHLASGADKTALERRNWDVQQITTRTRFEPIQDAMDLNQTTGEQIGDEDFAFWAGDLNYRLEGIPGDDVRRLLMLHTRNEYDLSQRSANKIETELQIATDSINQRIGEEANDGTSSSQSTTIIDEVEARDDPASLQTTISSLLPHDELHQQIRSHKAFHDGWREGPISFLPTYKYDVGSVGVFDSSEKKRAPSWCDRILYRTRKGKLAYDTKIQDEINARKKDEEMKARGMDEAGNDEEILYDYDPETDGAEATYEEHDEYHDNREDGTVHTREGYEDEIQLEYYTAHQRVLSSDHKPLNAVFILKYEAVDPELKAKVHAEEVRELDKAENEGRPTVTVVVDQHQDTRSDAEDLPAGKLEGVWFGDVKWSQPKYRTLTVANTGRVPASFTLIERPAEAEQKSGIGPGWLNIKLNDDFVPSSATSTSSITLEPGDSCIIDLMVAIYRPEDVRDLNEGKRTIEDILVLRVQNGQDHFVPIRGHWLESSLARTIDKLIRIPEGGIRKLQRQKPDSNRGSRDESQDSPASKTGSPAEHEPVRFSAPRELFRLTEAIEDLSTRVIAEWEMTNAISPDDVANDDDNADVGSRLAPWDIQPGWPFEEAAWTERSTDQWELARSEACNSLDCDQPLESGLLEDLPRVQRLYVLCSLLLVFLHSMPDGVVTVDLWANINDYLADNEKAKRKPSNEDQRTTFQELLAHSPSHSITFVLITSMLERIIHEMSGVSKNNIESPTSSTKKPGGPLRRISGFSRKSEVPPKQQASLVLARTFADAMIRMSPGVSPKARPGQERRRVEFVETFLRREESE